jgi:hypothetical protein
LVDNLRQFIYLRPSPTAQCLAKFDDYEIINPSNSIATQVGKIARVPVFIARQQWRAHTTCQSINPVRTGSFSHFLVLLRAPSCSPMRTRSLSSASRSAMARPWLVLLLQDPDPSDLGLSPLPHQEQPSNCELQHRPSRYKLSMANPVHRASMACRSSFSMPLPACA